MRVLEINLERTWRGGERQTLYTLEGLRALGVAADLLCRRGSPLAARAAGVPGSASLEVSGALAALRLLALRGGEYDVLHAQTARGHSLAFLAKPWHGRPIVYTRRVNFVPRGPWARFKYLRTERLVANNGAARETLLRLGARRVEVIPSAVRPRPLDGQRAAMLRERLGLEGRRVLGAVGELVPQKDPLTLVRTVGELVARGEDAVLLHFGAQPMRAVVDREIERLALGERVHLLGHQESVEDYFPLFEVLVVAATSDEGFVSSVLDAFVYSVPVVAARTGGLEESVGERGLLCPPGDPAALAEGVQRMLHEEALRTACVERARADAAARFSVEAMTARYRALFAELCGEEPVGEPAEAAPVERAGRSV